MSKDGVTLVEALMEFYTPRLGPNGEKSYWMSEDDARWHIAVPIENPIRGVLNVGCWAKHARSAEYTTPPGRRDGRG